MVEELDLVGRTIAGRFTLTDRIGSGGFASVYRGVQDGGRLPRDVAVKIMKPELACDESFLRRFRLEARAATRLEHPNSVRVLDSGVDGELAYIAMELLIGEDLCEVLQRDGRLTEARAARVVAEVCQALAAAHERGVVHRDLKPENIMLVRDRTFDDGERIKVLDFGVAKLVEPTLAPGETKPPDPPSSVPSAITRAGTVMGTPSYMAPEQAMGEAVDCRTDVYACGVLLYQLVTGRLPFDGDSAMQIVMQHVHRAAPSPRAVVPAIHPGLEACVLKALQKRPADRQQSARQLEAELRQMLPALAAARLPSLPPRAGSEKKRPAAGISPPFLRVGLDTPFSASASDQMPTQRKELKTKPSPYAPPGYPASAPAPSKGLDYVATPLVVALPRESDEGGGPSQARRGVRVDVVEPDPQQQRDPRTGTMRSRRDELMAEVARLGRQREAASRREAPSGSSVGTPHTPGSVGTPRSPDAASRKAVARTGTLPQGQALPKLFDDAPASTTTASEVARQSPEAMASTAALESSAQGVRAPAPASPAAKQASTEEATRVGGDERGPDSMPASSSAVVEVPIVRRGGAPEPAVDRRRKRSERRAERLARRDRKVVPREDTKPRGANDKRAAGPMQHLASTPPGIVIGLAVAVLLVALAYFSSR